jgi:hypothetical protein
VAGLYNGLFVMRDRQTGSIWTHYDGSILQGPLAGQGVKLEILPAYHTTGGDWRTANPNTMVLGWNPEFADNYRQGRFEVGRAGLGPEFQRTLLNWDDRLPENELVLGVNHYGEQRAYVLSDMGAGMVVIADMLGGDRLAIFADPGELYALAFVAVLKGKVLIFSVQDGVITDQTGAEWDMQGRALTGPHAGARLTFATSFVSEWYGWSAYFPETTIYGR